ncbi:MAG TPA: VWA domain-containing protein, partial [Blastocatellia bacterium]|nr:VWA domain-containing protein [Blastocatellia bacterium]
AAVEFLKAAPEISQLIPAQETRVWGEIGRRLSATSAETAADFFQSSAKVLASIPQELRAPVLRLVSKQAALSANTAVECFKSAPGVISSIRTTGEATEILDISLELARHSVKHSCDLFMTAPAVLSQLTLPSGGANSELIARSLHLTSAFAMKSGGTAAEFFSELPLAARLATASSGALERLFANTEAYLERSGGVALQYYKAASRVLAIGGEQAFDRWSELAGRVSLQGNAASYHFMKASPQILSDIAVRAGERRQQVISAVLEIVEEIGNHNSAAAVECFKASPIALGAASLGQFRDWALRGIKTPSDDIRKLQAYYALESRGSQEALFRIEGGLTLDAVSQTLRFYVEGLTGHPLNIAPLSAIPEEVEIGDGKTIRLPSVVAEFETESDNFRLFKVIAAHAAGQVEFGTYAKDTPELVAARDQIRMDFGLPAVADEPPRSVTRTSRSKRQPASAAPAIDFSTVLQDFPDPDFATRLFTTIENGRIDFTLRKTYKGIRRDLDAVRARFMERRPKLDRIPLELVPFELLFQISLCGGVTEEAMLYYPALSSELTGTMRRYVQRDDATVADSLMASRRIYSLFTQHSSDAAGNSDRSASGKDGEGAGELAPDGESLAGESDEGQKIIETQDDPFSFWAQNLVNEASPDYDQFSHTNAESLEQDLEKGDRPFYYDEWDRELGDYRTRWCRIIERQGSRGARSFVELVRSRYAGVISSVRYQFQLLRPENLRRIRGETDGEDYDLQAVIDYALDRRASGRIDDRLYTRKLRRERDVAVSFLLDMSSSTARTISRDPRKPYTQPGQRIIDIEKEGLVLMSEALEAVGDAYAMQGFTSEGRRNVKFYVIKDFGESYSPEIERRIGGITYQNNTRLGAAIRHATTRLNAQEARTKLLIVLSDGRPYDHDYGDSRYAREDTRMALRQARLDGITSFCITIDRESEDQLRDMYGEVGYTIIDDVLSLPERLPGIYSRLTT